MSSKLTAFSRSQKSTGYEQEFHAANARRSIFGLAPLPFTPTASRFLPGDDATELNRAIAPVTSQFTSKDFAFQCLAVHKRLMEPISNQLGVTPVFTIGYFRLENDPMFEFSEETLKKWAREGVPDFTSVELHAWLTLPSFEILDYTLGASIYALNKDDRLRDVMAALHYSSLVGMSYHPMVLGADIPGRIGAEITVFKS